MLLAFLACGAFFPAKAENKDNAEGSFTPQGESEAIFTYTYHNEVKADGYYPNYRLQLTEAGIAKGYTSVLVICQIWKGQGIIYQGNIINQSDFDANHAAQGYCHVTDLAVGDEYTAKMVVKLNPGSEEKQYDLTITTFTVSGSSDPSTPKQPTLSISDPSYTYKDASTVTASIKVNYENPDNVTIQGIRVGAVGAPGEAVAGKEYRHDWNKTDDGTGDIVWGDIMLPANWATGEKNVSFDLVNLPENNANINAYFKAYIIPAEGANIEAAQQHLVVSTINPNPTPALSIAEASCAYKSTTSVTASMKLNVENIDGTIRMAVLSTDENLSSGIWNQDDKPYKILAEKTVSAAEAAAGVTFDVENLPESTATPIVFAACTTDATPVYAPTVDGTANTSQTEPGMVNTVYSESYNVAPYTNGISYTAANFNEDGSVKWTFPEWTGGKGTNGISGRYVTVTYDNGKTPFAPKITYNISNDIDGYLYFTMTIDRKVALPEGLSPQLYVNNNPNAIYATMKKVDGDNYSYTWSSKNPNNTELDIKYPNESTISYQLTVAYAGGVSITRVFGYDVKNATNAPQKQPASVELTQLARDHYKDDHMSAQIYIVPAYDSYKAPQESEDPIAMGTWAYTRCPNDFAHLNTEASHFSPEMYSLLSNDSQDNEEGKKSKLYFAFQLGESYTMEKNETTGELESRRVKTILPNVYRPQMRILRRKATTASTRADNNVIEDTGIADYSEVEVIDMQQVRGYVNTYQGTTENEYDPNSDFYVGIKHTFTSIIGGSGYSRVAPRRYVMSSKDEVVTGIEEVASEAEAVPAVATVYNLQGMAVRVNVATENALEGLPAGIYIVNGKKYAVR